MYAAKPPAPDDQTLGENGDAIAACVRRYTGLSWLEYAARAGSRLHHRPPPIPGGMQDADDFMRALTEKECFINACAMRLRLRREEIEDMANVRAALRASVGGGVAPPFFHMQARKEALERECAQLEAQMDTESERLRRHAICTHVIDARSFQRELGALLGKRLELTRRAAELRAR